MKLTTLLLFVLLVSSAIAKGFPQQQVVTGTVTDSLTGEPLPGVHVIIENTLLGSATDLNGKFSIAKPEKGAVIAFSFVGYVTEKITWSGQSTIDVKLSQNVKALDEVVVIGYGTIKKSDLTGAVASVSSKDIEKAFPLNIEAALQGRVPGLMITANSGAPGSEAVITVRGMGTVNNNNPIYVVDGMIINPGSDNDPTNISFLNPADIASIEVLKDASAQAIYGSRGANGVILITTKKGTEGAPKVTFSSSIGFDNIIKIPKVLNAAEFKDYILTSHYNGYMRTAGANPNALRDTLDATTRAVVAEYKNGIYTNWIDEILRKNVINQNYNLSISGGTKYAHYSVSAGYNNNDGLIKNYSYKRYAFRLNTDFKLGDYITVGENLGVTSSTRRGNNSAAAFQEAMIADPLSPVFKPQGSVDPNDPDYKFKIYNAAGITQNNPVLEVVLQNWKNSSLTLVGNMFAEASILKEIKIRSSWGFNLVYNDISDFNPEYYLTNSIKNELSTVWAYNNRTNGWVWENTITYNKNLKDHSITALFGYTSEYLRAAVQKTSKEGTPNNNSELQTFDAATFSDQVSGSYNINTLISYIGRLNYSFRDKYLLTASIRRDGSSKFGEGHKWGIFPSFSLGWRINNEKFFKDLGVEFISNLKLRAGWGEIGNSSLPVNSAYVSQVSSSPTAYIDNRYIFNGNVYQGYSLSTIGTPDISWETSEQTNIGLEIAILKNALSLIADYYIKNTNNMLLQLPVPLYAGYLSSSPYSNAGSVQNKGIELILNWQGKSGNFSYGASINGSTFKNKVTSLGPWNNPIISEPSKTEVGSSIGRFYGYKTDGIFQTEDDVQNYKGSEGTVLQPNAHPGDFRFKNLNNDDAIDVNDETWIGNPLPKLTYGLNINLGYKAFDFVIFFQGTYGNDIFCYGIWRQENFQGSQNDLEYIYKNAWRGPGTSNNYPILTTVDLNNNERSSDYFVEDGSYIRLKNLQFGFNFPKALCDKLKITNGRIYIGGTNLLTFTKYHGIDPEVGAAATPVVAGYDWNNLFPQSREISVGLNISF